MKEKLNEIKKQCIIIDIETSSKFPDGELIDIADDFENYVKFAKVKWLGMYSYKFDEYNLVNVMKADPSTIQDYIAEHKFLVGFNSEEFDVPVLYNNNLMPENKRFIQVDCMTILGPANSFMRNGKAFKNRGTLMGYKFPKNSMKVMAKILGLETEKGDIDYNIFMKTSWFEEETSEIKKYLSGDIKVTKEMFDKLWDFWIPFTEFLSDKNISNLSWIRSSIASLRYKGDCHTLGVEETYGEKPKDKPKERMGGNVIEPLYEEAVNVWYLDFSSLYPWIRAMFCIDNEITDTNELQRATISPSGSGCTLEEADIFHGNEMFKVKGYYDISEQGALAKQSIKHLLLRTDLKKNDPTNPKIYTIKIYENAGYGALRSPVFEQIHTPNAGWDICWIGQQMQAFVKKKMLEFGLETIAGDTDSVFVKHVDNEVVTKEAIQACLLNIKEEMFKYVPFPNQAFDIEIEYDTSIDYVMWPFSLSAIKGEDGKNLKNEKGRLIKKLIGKKKNYMYLYQKEVVVRDYQELSITPNGIEPSFTETKIKELKLKMVGLPVIKDTATPLGKQIVEETLKPRILSMKSAKFDKSEIQDITSKWLSKPNAMKGLAVRYKVKQAAMYKPKADGTESTVIQAQISRGYFGGQAGVIHLIKNKKVGRAGKTAKYCTYEEAVQAKLQMSDLDLTKLKNELSCFVRND